MSDTYQRRILMVAKKVKMRENDETKQNLDYWLSRPVSERLDAVTRLSAQLKKHPDERMEIYLYQIKKQREKIANSRTERYLI